MKCIEGDKIYLNLFIHGHTPFKHLFYQTCIVLCKAQWCIICQKVKSKWACLWVLELYLYIISNMMHLLHSWSVHLHISNRGVMIGFNKLFIMHFKPYCQNPNSTNNSIELNLRLDYILTERSTHHPTHQPTHHPTHHKLSVVVVNCPS